MTSWMLKLKANVFQELDFFPRGHSRLKAFHNSCHNGQDLDRSSVAFRPVPSLMLIRSLNDTAFVTFFKKKQLVSRQRLMKQGQTDTTTRRTCKMKVVSSSLDTFWSSWLLISISNGTFFLLMDCLTMGSLGSQAGLKNWSNWYCNMFCNT